MAHPYVRFRINLARHALAQRVARLRGSLEIVAILLGPALIGLLAFLAMPAMLAASQPLHLALPLLLLHGAAMSLPVLPLGALVTPPGVRAWLQPLPVPPQLERLACMAVAGLLTAPLALGYLTSLTIWMLQRPAWLLPVRAAGGTALSFLLTWAGAAWLLARAGGPPRPGSVQRAPVCAVQAHVVRPRSGRLHLWHRLFWLSLWRHGSLAGVRQSWLSAATLVAAPAWMLDASPLPRTAGAICTGVLLVLLVHEADNALRAQAGRVGVAAAAWPVDIGALVRHARMMLLLTLVPVLCGLWALGAAVGAWHASAGRLWLALACTMPPLLVLTPSFSARSRMALVALCMIMLCATGSKIWN